MVTSIKKGRKGILRLCRFIQVHEQGTVFFCRQTFMTIKSYSIVSETCLISLFMFLGFIWLPPASKFQWSLMSILLILNLLKSDALFICLNRQHNVHRLVLTWIGVIFQFMWRLGTITSRVLVLVLYSTVYKSYVFLVIILHWITMMLWVLSRFEREVIH